MERLFSFALLGIALVVLFAQLRSLFYLPVFDSYLWWGDESWLLVEWKEHMLHGIFRHPYALGATMYVGNGALLNCAWLTALLYGLPQILLNASTDPVTIGRIVTASCAILLITSTYYILRRIRAPHLLSVFALLLLITSKSFILTSHSARYDILTTLVLLWLFFYCSGKSRLNPILFGLLLPALLLVSVHAFVLGAALWGLGLYLRGYWRTLKESGLILLGVAIGAGGLYALTLIFGQAHGLLTSASGTGFSRNMEDLPLLRPFSRSVQMSNLVQRWKTVVEFSPIVLAYSVMALMLWMTAKLRNVRVRAGKLSSLTIGAILVLISWLLMESSAPTSYLIYILPIVIIAATACIARMLERINASAGLTIASMILLFITGASLSALSYSSTNEAAVVGLELSEDNMIAIDLSFKAVEKDATDSGIVRPRVLVQAPAVNEALRLLSTDPTHPFDLMTTQFIDYPATSRSPEEIVEKEKVNYVLLYASPIRPYYMREVDVLKRIVASRGVIIARAIQPMTDIGRSYFSSSFKSMPPDTLTVYRLRP